MTTPRDPAVPSTETQAADRLAQLEAENAKLRADLKSVSTGVMKQSARDGMMQEILDRIDANEKATNAFMRAVALGQTDQLDKEVATIQTQYQQGTAQRRYNAAYSDLLDQLKSSVKDDDGTDLVNLDTAPELESVRTQWLEAARNQDLPTLARLVAQSSRIANSANRKKLLSEAEKAKEVAKQAAAEAKKAKAGSLDMDAGHPAGAGASKQWTRDDLRNYKPNKPVKEMQKDVDAILDQIFAKRE